MTINLYLVGIGTGNPEHVTYQAVRQLQKADVIMVPRKARAKSDLADLRHQICDHCLARRPCLSLNLIYLCVMQRKLILRRLMNGMMRLRLSGRRRCRQQRRFWAAPPKVRPC